MSTLALNPAGNFLSLFSRTSAASADATRLQRRQLEALIEYPARERLLQELQELMGPDATGAWYGSGAVSVRHEAIEEAGRFLSSLPTGFLDSLEASPDDDGGCSLDWWRSKNRQLSISFDGHGQLHYAAILGPVERVSGRLLFCDSIPQEILRLLNRLS